MQSYFLAYAWNDVLSFIKRLIIDLSGFHPVGEVGGKLPPPPPHPKKRKRERRKEEKEREREREEEREVHGGGRGACIFLNRIVSDQYSPLLHDSII